MKNKKISKLIVLSLLLGTVFVAAQPAWAEDPVPTIAKGSGAVSVMVGYENEANGDYSSTFGYHSKAYTHLCLALGSWAYAGNQRIIGYVPRTDIPIYGPGPNLNAIAIGAGDEQHITEASGSKSLAIGFDTKATETATTAVGYNNKATGDHSSAIGCQNEANLLYATAVGYNNKAPNYLTSAIGYQNTASGDHTSAFGAENEAYSWLGAAFGTRNVSHGDTAAAFGIYNTAYTDFSAALGVWSVAGNPEDGRSGATNALAIGASGKEFPTVASAMYSTAIGYNTSASAEGALAVGYRNKASGQSSSAIGYENTASGNYSSAIGYANTASGRGASVVGYSNTASYASSSAFGYKNTASGINSSVFGVNNTASGSGSSAFGDTNTARGFFSSAIGYKNTAFTYYASAIGYQNTAYTTNSVAIGSFAVAGDQKEMGEDETGEPIMMPGDAINALAIGAGDENHKTLASGIKSIAMGYNSTATSENAMALGTQANASGEHAIAVGSNAVASEANSVALGAGSIAGALPISAEYTYMGTKISDSFAGKTPIAVVSVGAEGSERLITNVAAGRITATSTDAINGSQLWYVADSINSRINDVIAGMPVVDAGNNTKVDVKSEPLPEEPTILKAAAAPVEPEPEQSSPRKEPTEVLKNTYKVSAWDTTVEADAGEKNIIVTATIDEADMTRNYKLALNKDLVVDSLTATDIKAENAKVEKLTATDIRAENAKVEKLTATDIKTTTLDADIIQATKVMTDNLLAAWIDADVISALTLGAENITTETLVSRDLQAENAAIDIIHTKTIRLGSDVTIDDKGMSIAGGPSVTVDGIDAGGKKITNVAAGTSATDAVNYGQLTNIENNLENRISHVSDRINRVGATAAALAALHPMAEDAGEKLSVAVGTGTYRDKYAGALGMFYRPTERVMLSLGGSKSGGEAMANFGMTFALDKNVPGISSKAAMASEIKELKAKNASIEADNAAMKDKLATQDEKIAKLEQMVQALIKK